MPALSGTVKDAGGAFVSRLVRAYKRSTGEFAGAAISRADNGEWSIAVADASEYLVVVHDSTGDPHFAAVTLLLHGDGLDGGQLFPDSSRYAVAPSEIAGSVFTRTGQKKFGTAGIAVEALASYVRYSGAQYPLGTGDFTIESWIFPQSLGNERPIIDTRSTGGAGGGMLFISGRVLKYFDGAVLPVGITQLAENTWHHVAVTRASGVVRLFVNGAVEASANSAANLTNDYVTVGRSVASSTSYIGGIDDVRITKGIARYTASFTPPAGPHLEGLYGGVENAVVLDRLIPV